MRKIGRWIWPCLMSIKKTVPTKIMFVTGDRSEYELLQPIARAVQDADDFDAIFAVCGTHLVAEYGNTFEIIEADGFAVVAKIENLFATQNPIGRFKSLSSLMSGLADAVEMNRPDFLCVLGDREEALAAASCGVYMRCPVIHLAGGDVADDGNSDNPIRDAVTKLAHIHWPASKKSADRIVGMGESSWRVKNIGSTGIERLSRIEILEKSDLLEKLSVDCAQQDFCLLIHHPLLPEYHLSGEHAETTMQAIRNSGLFCFVSRSNSDPGRGNITKVQRSFFERFPDQFHSIGHLSRNEFVSLLFHAKLLIGNSSAGIIEAGFFKKPVVNVGNRQKGREAGSNVAFVDNDISEISEAIEAILTDTSRKKEIQNAVNPYGSGDASNLALMHLRQFTSCNDRLLIKEQSK